MRLACWISWCMSLVMVQGCGSDVGGSGNSDSGGDGDGGSGSGGTGGPDDVPTVYFCDGRCPTHGHRLEVLERDDASVSFNNLEDGRPYECTVSWDSENDAIDCATWPMAGTTETITTLGLHGTYCTGRDFGGFGLGEPQACAFQCDVTG